MADLESGRGGDDTANGGAERRPGADAAAVARAAAKAGAAGVWGSPNEAVARVYGGLQLARHPLVVQYA